MSSSYFCTECNKIKYRKFERPTYDNLTEDVKNIGYCATGRKYGVSDNCIRKWIKFYKNGSIV